jgi:hypothetical protein
MEGRFSEGASTSPGSSGFCFFWVLSSIRSTPMPPARPSPSAPSSAPRSHVAHARLLVRPPRLPRRSSLPGDHLLALTSRLACGRTPCVTPWVLNATGPGRSAETAWPGGAATALPSATRLPPAAVVPGCYGHRQEPSAARAEVAFLRFMCMPRRDAHGELSQ